MPLRILFALILAVPSGVFPLAGSENLRFKSYSVSEGLAADHVLAFFQDQKGYLWMGTTGGASRFDGQRFDNFPFEDQGSASSVSAILEDAAGVLWFATSSGLRRYDGRNFHVLTTKDGLPDDEVTALALDRRGVLWIGTKKGIASYDGVAIRPFGPDQGLPKSKVNVLFEDREGGLWVGYKFGGAARFLNGRWSVFTVQEGLPNLIVNDIRADSQGVVWIATHGGVAVFKGQGLQAAPFNDGLPSKIIYSITIDPSDHLWMRTTGSGLLHWDGSALSTYSEKEGLGSPFVYAILRDSVGSMWIGTTQGLSRLMSGTIQTYKTDSGLASDNVTALFQDKEGGLWIGTTGGISRWSRPRISAVLLDEALARTERPGWMKHFFKDKAGNLWFPSSAGLGRYDGVAVQVFTTRDGLPHNHVKHILETDAGILWVTTPQGPAAFDGIRFQPAPDPRVKEKPISFAAVFKNTLVLVRDDNGVVMHDGRTFYDPKERGFVSGGYQIRDVVFDTDGHPWFLTTNGVIRYDGTTSAYYSAQDVLPSSNLSDLRPDPKLGVWIGTTKGIARWDGRAFQKFGASRGIPEGDITFLGFDKAGNLWLQINGDKGKPGSFTGPARFDGKTLRTFSMKDGLASDEALDMRENLRGGLWFRTSKGVSRFDGRAFVSYGTAEGLLSPDVTTLLTGPSGSLWIGTDAGLNKYLSGYVSGFTSEDGLADVKIEDLALDATDGLWIRTSKGIQRFAENRRPPGVEMTSLSIGGNARPVSGSLTLRHDENNLQFIYRGISLSERSGDIRYIYTLEGYGRDWYGPLSETKVLFHNLKAGRYVFKVKALNKDLVESREAAELTFRILPPFWETWWFIIGSILGIGLLAFSAHRLRLKAKVEKVRIQHELQVAHDMQMALMPAADPEMEHFDIAGICVPAKEVGGDYFDYFWLDESRTKFGLAIADVTGKAMKASIIAVMTSGMIHSEVGNTKNPAGILRNINKPLFLKTDSRLFTTMIFAVLDLPARTLTLANAGHLFPLFKHGDTTAFIQLGDKDIPLGIEENVRFEETTVSLEPGDRVLFYTDGLTEAMSVGREMFGFERTEAFVRALGGETSREVLDALLARVREFAGRAEQHDDITLVSIRVKD